MVFVSKNGKNYFKLRDNEIELLPLKDGIVWAADNYDIAVAYSDVIKIYSVTINGCSFKRKYSNNNEGIKHIILFNKIPICFYENHVIVIMDKHDPFIFNFDYVDIFDDPLTPEKISISAFICRIKFPTYHLLIDILKRSTEIINVPVVNHNIIWGDKNKGISLKNEAYYMWYKGIHHMIKIIDFDISLLEDIISKQCIRYDGKTMIGYHVLSVFDDKYTSCSNKI